MHFGEICDIMVKTAYYISHAVLMQLICISRLLEDIMTTYNIKIITPEKTFYNGSVEQVIVRTSAGNVGILAGHSPYVANIVSSPLKLKIDGDLRTAAISGGLLKVSSDGVSILCPAVEWADEIDIDRAELAKKRAEEKLRIHENQKESERAEQELRRALNRLYVASNK